MTVEAPWARPAPAVAAELGVAPAEGLAEDEAARRRARWGPNALRATPPVSWASIFLAQFRSLVVLFLLAAMAVSLVAAQWLEAGAIAAVVLLNAAIGFLTELRAVRSMEALRQLGSARVRVRRGGRERALPADELVPGDVVPLEAGDVVAADLRIVEASKLSADESTLTGESVPVAKGTDAVAADAPLSGRTGMLMRGTAVVRGAGLGVVTATGMATELGAIADLAAEAEASATPLERRLEELGRRLVWLTVGIAAVTGGVGILRGRDLVLMLETAIALAVAAIPEGLPIVATLALARGMWRMARRNVLINRLSAVETLGATDVILTDKTGTLTENRMTVARLVLADRAVEAGDLGRAAADPAVRAALEIALLCNDASLEGGVGDPLELALLAAGAQAGLQRPQLVAAAPEVREEAFDPALRLMATVHAAGAGFRVTVKGGPEAVLARCTAERRGNAVRPLDAAGKEEWLERGRRLAAAGLRVLALAEKTVGDADAPAYAELCLVALVGMHDPPRSEIAASLASARAAGVRVVMVTGDHGDTARSIGRGIGLVAEEAGVVSGADLPARGRLPDADAGRLRGTPIFARVEPAQKLELVRLHQEAGSVVAMTGDGVNDAPALRKADIGIAMGRRGTQVAREAADMVLRDDAFASIIVAIRYGRVIFANIRRFVVYLLSCNLSEIAVVFLASLLDLPLPVLPLQILYLNLVTDVFPALALGFGEGDALVMRRPPRPPGEPILAPRHWRRIAGYAALLTVAVLGALLAGLEGFGFPAQRAVTVSFLVLAFAQLWHVFNLRAPGSGFLRNDVTANRWVWGALGLCTGLLLLAVYLPPLAAVLKTADPGARGWALALGASVFPVLAVQAARVLAPRA